MARIFIDGFESGNLDLWDSINGVSITSSSPISGTYMLNVSASANYWIYKNLSQLKSELYFAFKYKPTSISALTTGVIGFRDSAGAVSLCLSLEQTTGLIKVTRGDLGGGTLLATGTTPLVVGSTYLIELRYKPLNSGGIVQLKINGGALEVDYSGDTTNGLENISIIGFGRGVDGNTTGAYYYLDDLVIDDANWIGNTKIQALVPTGAGATTQHAASIDAHPTSLGNQVNVSFTGPYVNIRTIIAGSYITQSGSKIRLGLVGYTITNNTNIAGCSIGLRDGSTSSFSGSPTRVTLGGSNSFTIEDGYSITWSDWINFDLVANTDYIVHFYLSGATCYTGYAVVSETSYYESNADANDTESISISGYTTDGSSRYAAFGIMVEKSASSNNYLSVDETPPSDTDYIKTSSGQIDTYQMGNIIGYTASIKCVAVQSRNWREGNGAYDRGQHIVRPASTDRLAAAKTNVFPISPTGFQSIWELNPEDSAAWEEADVNGMEAGIKAVEA